MTPTAIVAYLALFATVGFAFVFASLLLGRVFRSRTPTPQKHEIYECGEPAVGPGSVQFDLRFYVVALVFLIFEVEVALFFPTATIFGKASQLLSPNFPMVTTSDNVQLSPELVKKYQELQVSPAAMPSPTNPSVVGEVTAQANTLALASMLDLGVFFAVLLVGFAYVWRRGDLDWVRATRHPTTTAETAAAAMKLRGDR